MKFSEVRCELKFGKQLLSIRNVVHGLRVGWDTRCEFLCIEMTEENNF